MQPKSKQYETSDTHVGIRPSSGVLLGRGDLRDKDIPMGISKVENDLYKILRKNKHDSIWGEAIKLCTREVKEKGNIERFRRLIVELKSQCKDNRLAMENIIGEEAVKLLMEIS